MTTPMDRKALRVQCRLLVESMQNSYCVLTQTGLIRAVSAMTGHRWETDALAVKIMEALHAPCYEWLTQPRSDAELEELGKSACHCTGNILHPALERAHEQGRQMLAEERNANPGWAMVLTWILMPFDASYVNSNLEVRGMHTLSRSARWPRSITSILPHGPERTIHTLLRLFQTVTAGQRRQLYAALLQIMSLCHPLVSPLLVRSSQFLQYGIEGFIDTPVPVPSDDINTIVCNVAIVSTVEVFIQLIHVCVSYSFNDTERIVFEGREPQTLLSVYGRCLEICKSARKLVGHQQYFAEVSLSSERIKDNISQLFKLSTRLLVDFPDTCSTAIPAYIRGKVLGATALLRHSSFQRLAVQKRIVLAMHHLKIRQQCTAPGCFRSRADGRLGRCAQCKRVPYCSRSCQKAAWAHIIAHRDVYKSIVALCDAYAIPERDAYNYRPPKGLGDTASCKEMGLQVLDHFARLTELNMAMPSSMSTCP
jgi:hypothetical protein